VILAAVKEGTEDEIRKVKNVCNKKLPDIQFAGQTFFRGYKSMPQRPQRSLAQVVGAARILVGEKKSKCRSHCSSTRKPRKVN